MSFAEVVTADIRLVMLRALAEDTGYSHNESVLQSVLEVFGHGISRDRIRTELSWLAEQGLVTLRDAAGYLVATLTGRGGDVAAGRVTVPGVKRPRPRD
jgi:Fe2+ or Zn2+ uptake regulation protein